jgi:hypothetical protein
MILVHNERSAARCKRVDEQNVMSRVWRFDMKALSKLFVLVAALALASCGGGGGGSKGAFEPTPSDTITISPAATTIPANSFTTLTVTVKKNDGSFENDGTLVNASVSPLTIGSVSGSGAAGTTASNTLSGGHTSFVFNSSSQGGNATISISVPAGTNGSTTVAVATQVITVSGGNGQDPRLQITATATTLPASPFTLAQQQVAPFPGNFLGSPYVSEVTLTFRNTNGTLVNAGTANVSISPSSLAGLSLSNGDGLHTIVSSGTVNIVAGTATVYVHAGNLPGTATLTATTTIEGQTVTSSLPIVIAGSGSTVASSVTLTSSGTAYVSNSGGPQSAVVTAIVKDANGALVADPNGFNNVQFSIVGPAGSDGRITGTDAAGNTVTGTTINVRTHSGVAAVSFLAGTQQGPVQIRATIDRGDNNVDNSIQDPVSATITVVVSDGRLFSITLTSPVVNAILVNRVSTDTTLVNQGTVTIPPDPNATYALTVTAFATDRQGNPVLPGTIIRFGVIDAPQQNGVFSISGVQGDPQEGGTLFTALDGHFRTAGGGAGPGDTLIVFGKDVPGNEDLESATKVSVVNSETTLHVVTPFNLNNTTGVSVNYGAVLPYVVGRAQTGNITSPAVTNQFGAATTTLNYPVSALGRTNAIWAQSDTTDPITGGTKVVTDAEIALFPGVAPAKITISPNPIPGNITLEVDACIVDALQSPISGVRFTFAFQNLGIGSGKLDGISGSGLVPDVTDASGCVATTVTTNGIASTATGDTAPKLTFSVGDATASAPIVASGNLILLAKPSALGGRGGTVVLTLLTGNGSPVPGVQLVGTCTGDASIGIASGPGVTGADGSTTAVITANLDGVGGGKSGSCTFTTSTGTPSVKVTLQGVDVCLTSPHPIACDTGTNQVNLTVVMRSTGSGASGPYGSLTSEPAGLDCTMASANDVVVCQANFTQGSTVALSVVPISGTTIQWGGSCSTSGASQTTNITMNTQKNCTLDFKP